MAPDPPCRFVLDWACSDRARHKGINTNGAILVRIHAPASLIYILPPSSDVCYAFKIESVSIALFAEPLPFELGSSVPGVFGGRSALASSSASEAPRLRQAISLVQKRRSMC